MDKKFEELQRICEPVVQYIRENYDPHTQIVVTDDSVTVMQKKIGVPFALVNDSTNGIHTDDGVGISSPIPKIDLLINGRSIFH